MQHNGFQLHVGALNLEAQTALATEVLAAVEQAPFYDPLTPGGRSMSIRQTNLGPWGWLTDAQGYRYGPLHPLNGAPWPKMPQRLLALWDTYVGSGPPPDSCLVNFYRGAAKMGLHRDSDEADLQVPVLSVSLGDSAIFRLGGRTRSERSLTVKLHSGDVAVLAGAARLAYHGVDRILPGSSALVPGGGRLNLTLRRARP